MTDSGRNRRYLECANQMSSGPPLEHPIHCRSAVTHDRAVTSRSCRISTDVANRPGSHHRGRASSISASPLANSICSARSSLFSIPVLSGSMVDIDTSLPSPVSTVQGDLAAISGRHGRAPTSNTTGVFSVMMEPRPASG